MDKVLEILSEAGHPVLNSTIVWAMGSIAIYKFCFFATQRVLPGFPYSFLEFCQRNTRLELPHVFNFFLDQIDIFFKFREVNILGLKTYFPSFWRSALASCVVLFIISVFMTIQGNNVFLDAWNNIFSTTEFERQLKRIDDGIYETQRYDYEYEIWLDEEGKFHAPYLIYISVITAIVAFLINLFADYISISQTRKFISILRSWRLLPIIIIFDFLVSIFILLISVISIILISSIIIYVFFEYHYFSEGADILSMGNFSPYFFDLVIPSMLIAASLIVDGFLNLFSSYRVTPSFLEYLESVYLAKLPIPQPVNLFSLLVVSSLMTSIWLYLNTISVLFAGAFRLIPGYLAKIIEWTRAETKPIRLIAFFMIKSWTIFWVIDQAIRT